MQNRILVTKSTLPSLDEYVDEIKSIWDTHWLTNMGEKHLKFEKEIEKFLNVKKIELLVNGHMALEMTLQAMHLHGEVITTPFSFASTTHAIVRNGLTPVFCDIDPVTYTIDADKIEQLITPKTCAIMPVHVYGNVCDVEKIEKIAKKYGLKVIYDAAHAFGVKYKGRSVGSFGDASIFSFHATKVMNSIEGGAVCCNDITLAYKLYNLKNFGIKGPEVVEAVGANAKMNEFCAAMGICNLRHLEDEIKKRKKVVQRYLENLHNIEGIVLNGEQDGVVKNYSYFPICINKEKFGLDRDEVFNILDKKNIGARKYFYPLITDYDCYCKIYKSDFTPIAKKIASQVMTLPLYGDLDLKDVDRICKIIIESKRNK